MKKFLFTAVLLLSFGVTGCQTTSGNQKISDSEVIGKIVEGKSTQADVRTILGEPNSVSAMKVPVTGENGKVVQVRKETWVYVASKSTTSAKGYIPVIGGFLNPHSGESHSYTVNFDQNGVVETVSRSSASSN